MYVCFAHSGQKGVSGSQNWSYCGLWTTCRCWELNPGLLQGRQLIAHPSPFPFKNSFVCVCMYVGACVCHGSLKRSEDSLWESVLSFCYGCQGSKLVLTLKVKNFQKMIGPAQAQPNIKTSNRERLMSKKWKWEHWGPEGLHQVLRQTGSEARESGRS